MRRLRDNEIQWHDVCGVMLNSEASRSVIDISEFVCDKLWPEPQLLFGFVNDNEGHNYVMFYTRELEENPQEIASKLTS